jgi:hypothetical protein
VTLQALLDCAGDSFHHYDENRDVWMTIRSHCQVLLSAEDFWRYQELIDKEYFEYDCEENRLDEWRDLCAKFDPDDEDIGSSDHEGQMNLRDEFENNAKVTRERVIAYHQLKAFSLYLEDKPAEFAAYREFLVSIFYFGTCMYFFLQ